MNCFLLLSTCSKIPLLICVLVALSLPPAVKVLAVLTSVFAILQALKRIPVVQTYLTGWVAIVFNVLFTGIGTWITVPADQFWTTNTIIAVLTTALGAAGVHGTYKQMSAPKSS